MNDISDARAEPSMRASDPIYLLACGALLDYMARASPTLYQTLAEFLKHSFESQYFLYIEILKNTGS